VNARERLVNALNEREELADLAYLVINSVMWPAHLTAECYRLHQLAESCGAGERLIAKRDPHSVHGRIAHRALGERREALLSAIGD